MPKPGDAPATEPVNSIRDALAETYDTMAAGDAVPAVEPTPVEQGQAAEAPDTGKDGRTRGPDGKFAKKADEPAEAAADQQQAVVVAPTAAQAIDPEDHWSEQDKQAFRNIPPEHRSWVMERYKRLEADNTKKSQEAASLRSFKQQFDAILEPHRAELQAMGTDEIGAVRTLIGIRDYLRRDPTTGIRWLAQQFEVDLAQLNSPENVDPATQAIRATENQLGGRIQQLEQQIQSDRMNQAFRMLDNFAQEKDTSGTIKHPHFEAVVNDMTQLMRSGMVPMGDLSMAYDKALRLHPELTTPATTAVSAPATPASAATVTAQAPSQKETLDKAAEAARARKASAGVSGGGNGKAESKLSLRDELAARMDGSL